MGTATTTVSAPGKILLAGGYLVLESPNVGLVVAVDKRFFTTVQFLNTTPTETTVETMADTLRITVQSPQFGQEWKYLYHKINGTLSPDNDKRTKISANPFVEKTLRVSLAYLTASSSTTTTTATATAIARSCASKTKIQQAVSLRITILADNDFYSLVPHLHDRHLDQSLGSVHQLPLFLPAATNADGRILKTGLGSSAALVTSLVGALCHATLDAIDTNRAACNDDDDSNNKLTRVIANLAQVCHCHAQGKVGSGFDVSSACYGSHVYQRFPAATLADLLTALDRCDADANAAATEATKEKQQETIDLLMSTVQQTWTGGVVAPLQLPAVLQVMLADVSGGSESPSMARTVLQWKQQFESTQVEATATTAAAAAVIPYWDDLQRINQTIVQLLQRIAATPVSAHEKQALVTSRADDYQKGGDCIMPLLYQLHQAFQESRRNLKAMGDAAGVPIEPDAQTALADATLQLPGVVTALVPGAGGYDAVACVYINDETVRQNIGQLWATWSEAKVCPLTIQGVSYGQGLCLEPHPPN